jgi:hypothetical protein
MYVSSVVNCTSPFSRSSRILDCQLVTAILNMFVHHTRRHSLRRHHILRVLLAIVRAVSYSVMYSSRLSDYVLAAAVRTAILIDILLAIVVTVQGQARLPTVDLTRTGTASRWRAARLR